MIPADRFDPVTVKMVNAYPLPQTSALTNNYTSNMSQQQSWDQGDVRVDQNFGSNDTFFARYSIQHTTTIVPPTYPPTTIAGISHPLLLGDEASFAGTSFQPVQHAAAAYTHIFSPTLINDVRIGFNRYRDDYTLAGTTASEPLGVELGVANANPNALQTGLPIFSPASYEGIGMSRSLPIYRRENTFEELDNVTWTKGTHTIKFGVDVRRRQITEYQTNRGNGRFNFSTGFTAQPGVNSGDSIASMLLGYPTLYEQDYLLVWPGIRGIETGLYFADDWRVSKKLTVNLGMRWEYYSPYSEVANRWANFNPTTGEAHDRRTKWRRLHRRRERRLERLRASSWLRLSGALPYRDSWRARTLLQSQRKWRRATALRSPASLWTGPLHQPRRPDSGTARQQRFPRHAHHQPGGRQ